MDSTTRSRIESSFAAQSLMTTFGTELAHVSEGDVRIRAPILPGSRQQQGYAHAGLTFSIGDHLIASGRVIKPGRRLIVVAADFHAVTGDTHKLIAVLQGTMVPVAL